jgi:ABC-type branched-subunit amino acid transport system ATPase component
VSLTAEGLVVQFGGIRALDGVSLEIPRSEITGIVGPNGAGKTTFFNCVTGFVRPHEGRILLDGQDVTSLPPHKRARAGLARSFQTPRVVNLAATALEATAVGCYVTYRPSLVGSVLALPGVRRREREVDALARKALEDVGLAELTERPVSELSLAQLRLLEVARTIVGAPRLVLLDEPAAGLDPQDRERLATTLRDLCSRHIGVLIIEHNLDFIARVSHRVTVMHRGRVLFSGGPDQFRESPAVREAYVGGPVAGRREG